MLDFIKKGREMRIKIIGLSILVLIASCTTDEGDSKLPLQDYNTVTVETINTNLKVVNIVVDQEEFDHMYENYEEDIEIEAYFNLYKNNVLEIDSKLVELQIKGSYSTKFPLKSLGMKFDNTYNNAENNYNLIDPDLLPFHNVDEIKSFRLRNSGNDFELTMVKDMSYTKLAIDAGLNIDVMYAEQMVVFVNNSFLGILNFRTEKNDKGVSRLYGVSKNDITLAKIEHPGILVKKDGDFDKIDAFENAIKQGDYNYIVSEVEITNVIDYFIYESFIGNGDWPINNVLFFAIEDGPFRFLLYDLDLASHDLRRSPMKYIYNKTANLGTGLFDVLYSNPDFKLQYDTRWNELMESDLLTSHRFDNIVNTYKENVEVEMKLQIDKYKKPETLTNWYINLEELKNKFKRRENYVK
ncbi:MAG: CotH kinase family protein [Flavobacteriaceae bacterium]|nr:CotH kinase family protein [Flavobacteriaceae bacterium]